jgi:hypothetical protein
MNNEAPGACVSNQGFFLRRLVLPESAAALPLLTTSDRKPTCEEQAAGVEREDCGFADGDQGHDDQSE